jgi:hypothetical protein
LRPSPPLATDVVVTRPMAISAGMPRGRQCVEPLM